MQLRMWTPIPIQSVIREVELLKAGEVAERCCTSEKLHTVSIRIRAQTLQTLCTGAPYARTVSQGRVEPVRAHSLHAVFQPQHRSQGATGSSKLFRTRTTSFLTGTARFNLHAAHAAALFGCSSCMLSNFDNPGAAATHLLGSPSYAYSWTTRCAAWHVCSAQCLRKALLPIPVFKSAEAAFPGALFLGFNFKHPLGHSNAGLEPAKRYGGTRLECCR